MFSMFQYRLREVELFDYLLLGEFDLSSILFTRILIKPLSKVRYYYVQDYKRCIHHKIWYTIPVIRFECMLYKS